MNNDGFRTIIYPRNVNNHDSVPLGRLIMKKMAIGFILGALLTLSAREIYDAFMRPENQTTPLPSIEKTRDRETVPTSTRKRAVIRSPPAREVAEAPTRPPPADLVEARQEVNQSEIERPEKEQDVISPVVLLANYYESQSREKYDALQEQIDGIMARGKDAVPELLALLEGDSSDMAKMIAASVLGEISAELNDSELQETLAAKALPLIESVLKGEGTPILKRQAVQALGNIKSNESVAVLSGLFNSGDRQLARSAMIALGEIGIEGSQNELIALATQRDDRWLNRMASRVLGQKGDAKAAYELLDGLVNTDDTYRYLMTTRMVGEINKRASDAGLSTEMANAVDRISGILGDDDEKTRNRMQAVYTLGRIDTPAANEVLLDLLNKGSSGTRRMQRSAQWALQQSSSPYLAERVASMLQNAQDESRRVQYASIIGSIAGNSSEPSSKALAQNQALPTLYELSSSGATAIVRKEAINAIARVGDTDDIDRLQQIKDLNPELGSTIDRAIQSINTRATRNSQNRRSGGRLGGMFY